VEMPFGRFQGVAVKPIPSLRLMALVVLYVWNGGVGAVLSLGGLVSGNWLFCPCEGKLCSFLVDGFHVIEVGFCPGMNLLE
jgi:hypothetical protein